jgi:hypothetical protein
MSITGKAFSCFGLLVSLVGLGAQSPETALEAKLVVRMYDYAQVPRRILTGAEQETARVFHVAGIQLSWVECGLSEADKERFRDCEHVTDPLRLFVNIIPQLVAPGLPPGKFGTSFGTHAVVLNRQVEKTAADKGFSKALILGYVMAHELGHLLLGNNSHGQGVMMGTFGRREFERAQKGELVFTPQQAKQMRVRILKSY